MFLKILIVSSLLALNCLSFITADSDELYLSEAQDASQIKKRNAENETTTLLKPEKPNQVEYQNKILAYQRELNKNVDERNQAMINKTVLYYKLKQGDKSKELRGQLKLLENQKNFYDKQIKIIDEIMKNLEEDNTRALKNKLRKKLSKKPFEGLNVLTPIVNNFNQNNNE